MRLTAVSPLFTYKQHFETPACWRNEACEQALMGVPEPVTPRKLSHELMMVLDYFVL